MFTIIAAVGKNREIGKNNSIIWDLPKDLKFFKEKTFGKKIFMGRKTYESLPGKLPNREHIVLSRSYISEDVIVISDIELFIKNNIESEEEIFVIGGGKLYLAMLPFVKKMYITEIDDTDEDADTFFPNFKKSKWKRSVISEEKEKDVSYKYVLYELK